MDIWLAEDDESMRAMLSTSLERSGLSVREFTDGAELLAHATQSDERPALLITDHHLPVHLGLECIEKLRAEGVDVPFILITAFGDARTHRWANTLGAERVFDKPFDLNALVHSVCTLCQADALS